MHGRFIAAVGHDVLDNAATGASQFVQSLKPRHPHGQIDVLAFMGDRQALLPVGCKMRHLSPKRTGDGADQRNGLDVLALRQGNCKPIGIKPEHPLSFEKPAFLGCNIGFG
jgi:hypothetical protein